MKRKYYFLIIMLLSVVYFTGTQPPEIADRIMAVSYTHLTLPTTPYV